MYANECLFLFIRRVHISQSTLNQLKDTFEVEPGNGGERDNYLKDRNVTTYFIIDRVCTVLFYKIVIHSK